MASSATVEDIQSHLDLKPQDNTDLTRFLETAQLIVAEDLANSGLSADRLVQITIFLGAHFATLAIEKGGILENRIDDTATKWKGPSSFDRGYLLTRYGQQAVSLDTTGALARNANAKQKAEFRVL